jgi:hypothetical protein
MCGQKKAAGTHTLSSKVFVPAAHATIVAPTLQVVANQSKNLLLPGEALPKNHWQNQMIFRGKFNGTLCQARL